MKKPAAKKAPSGAAQAAAAGAANLAQAVANAKASAKKPAAKKPAPGRKAVGASGAAATKKPPTAHQAHLAHLAHLQHLGLLPKAAAKPQRRMLALGEGVACCAAEAVAASLRLTGRRVSDADVLDLYRQTADDPDAGATILATLEAASVFGLAGVRPTWLQVPPEDYPEYQHRHPSGTPPGRLEADSQLYRGAHRTARDGQRQEQPPEAAEYPVEDFPHGLSMPLLILGVELPGSHAVLASPDGWWSWGELYDPACWPDAVTEEAWALTWG